MENVLYVRKISRLPVLILFSLGFIFLFFSFRYESLILGLIGAGCIFYGAIVYLIGYRGFIKADLLHPFIENSFNYYRTLFLVEGCKGRGVYLSLKGSESLIKVFVPLSEAETYVPLEGVIDKRSLRIYAPSGFVLDPPGYTLEKLIEKFLNVKFKKLEVHEAINKVSEGLNKLEVLKTLDYVFEEDRVKVRFTGLLTGKLCRSIKGKYPGLCEQIGCPFCSLVACVLCESTGDSVFIESTIVSPEGEYVETVYRFLR